MCTSMEAEFDLEDFLDTGGDPIAEWVVNYTSTAKKFFQKVFGNYNHLP